jgi:hypothetical protein
MSCNAASIVARRPPPDIDQNHHPPGTAGFAGEIGRATRAGAARVWRGSLAGVPAVRRPCLGSKIAPFDFGAGRAAAAPVRTHEAFF